MAYPNVPSTYGFKPVNLIGGQVFSGSTRQLPIQYGFNTNIFYGDVVGIARGFVTRETVTTGAGATTGSLGSVGIFLGCNYTDPVTKQKRYSQYWPAGTLAGDAFAVVTDDPDTVFQVAVAATAGAQAIGSVATAMIGLNIQGSDLAGNVNTGDSYNGVLASAVANTSTYPFRIVDLKRDSAVQTTATYSSGSGTPTLTVSALPSNLVVGTEVGYIASNGQYVGSGAWVSSFAAAGATTVVLNAAPATVASPTGTTTVTQTIPASATLVFTQYPEAYVKFNFGIHEYYNATANAATL